MGWVKRRALRRASLLCIAALLSTSCAAKHGSSGSPATIDVPCKENCEQASPKGGAPAPTGRANASPGGGPQASHEGNVKNDVDRQAVGALAKTYMRPSPSKLTIEIVYSHGDAPSAAVRDHLATILRRETRKTVRVVLGDEVPDEESYQMDYVVQLQNEHRHHHTSASEATAWIAWISGSLENGQGVLGLAFNSSSAVIFPDQIKRATTAVVAAPAIERAVLTHEFGHLLGLVNIGYTSAYDHEDPDHRGHSRYTDSVMYWVVEDISIAGLLRGGPPDDFDRYDRADLAMLRAS